MHLGDAGLFLFILLLGLNTPCQNADSLLPFPPADQLYQPCNEALGRVPDVHVNLHILHSS
jgi:hypothetical protein